MFPTATCAKIQRRLLTGELQPLLIHLKRPPEVFSAFRHIKLIKSLKAVGDAINGLLM